MSVYPELGVVVIGRNEGERLRQCLESIIGCEKRIVYVDSGSTDNSLDIARKLGVEILVLDVSVPFTAARARNAGYLRLLQLNTDINFVHFVDGDCEVISDWINEAMSFLSANADVAVVCGQRKERYPEKSIYNKLCDIEWNTPIGEAKACGGDAIYRVKAFEQVGGFRDDLIAGEEPELCLRIRQNQWKVWRLDVLMTLHDANMNKFGQWWKRMIRSGYAYTEGAYIHGKSSERHWVKESRRITFWGGLLPMTIVTLAFFNTYWFLLLLIYPLQMLRLAIRGKQNRFSENIFYAAFLVVGKFAEFYGQGKFISNFFRGRRGHLIEYK